METTNLEKNIKEIFETGKYVVPLYQRNYAWRKDEIEQLLQDIYEAYIKNKDGNYFIGSLVVLKRQNGDYEVIDGQQRLTTLSLITKILGITNKSCLFYDSRPEVEDFFYEFYKSDGNSLHSNSQIIHLTNAIEYINEANLDPNNPSPITIKNMSDRDAFIKFFSNNVILIRVEIPDDTDVASYFEIMNNRGVQLKKHEIIKSFLMAKIGNEIEKNQFALIWDACSQMDIPIQRIFNADHRKKFFGDQYDNYIFSSNNSSENETTDNQFKPFSIEDILLGKADKGLSDNNSNTDDNEIEEEVSEYKSIIDFPNFLMHVFKLRYKIIGEEIPLNEKYLPKVYDKINQDIDPKEFINVLLFCRTVFDRYILKTITDKNVEDEIKWTLHKPTKYEKSWKYTNTFGDTSDHERIIKTLSMLQVTFRTRVYKNWLQDILKWFYDSLYCNESSINIEAKEYIIFLDSLILKYYDERKINSQIILSNEHITRNNAYSLGTNTPHFIFNFIDYLFWVDSKNPSPLNKKYEIEKFDFKYWNSVEHHMAQEWAERNQIPNKDNFIDCFGNLCLISKSSNSRLSDRDVKEKVQTFGNGNLGAKRQVMYKMSKDAEDKYTWTEDKIREHYNDTMLLINKRNEILGY